MENLKPSRSRELVEPESRPHPGSRCSITFIVYQLSFTFFTLVFRVIVWITQTIVQSAKHRKGSKEG